MNEKPSVGGQAVIEGVMMRGSKGVATAVRKEDNTIELKVEKIIPYTKKNRFLGLPIIRGFVSLLESMIIGIRTLNYSASFFEDEENEGNTSKFDEFLKKIFKDKVNDVLMAVSLCISIIFAMGIFFVLPTFAANIFKYLNIHNTVVLNLLEGIIRVSLFILYLFLIGKMEDIQRVFQYHGAEHKTVFCYEHNEELTPENASKYSRFHPRCGTNFLFLVMIISILVFSLTGWNSLVFRIISRIVLLPIVSGVTYEVIRWMGRSDNELSKIFSYPGLMLQKLTTREPDYSQLEVAIKALKAAEGIEDDEEINIVAEEVEASS
ncbi:putative metal-dependent protein [Clostridium pasteurianum DSM 525 = ATCC 6013]|uniref:Putative metal-dependent protein n=1 Tax=Clostridium pasteurianum DSM 525 = ATCC 6013 TaxID=1262449 RepID=A0A0H3IZA5_CLOPA|nr:DUF1385 domain-containing protein [Clostridium pasteurianum]AJA46364.1 putative metal-dependent protein [Clostridium pasteurianum DSM 525 = ATCC 6013]AJA50352.1 putative metal-dependent protein [Clostridium pasteurianum DSM 525 = ATCC 6013]AOZ73801.1 hypothetical protein AQ983_01270 [Clostridium pasteurianum DSM 525 = ATCC 6013]AOZ77598.1 hypothetical protein AQ984_01270 [Clostridium pasteurianum]ELP60939.1 hypothetical protein F502_00740 [Clostridium pasteurianum DSM 525 = ATCC 6013]